MVIKAELFAHRRSCSHTEAKNDKIKEQKRPYQEFYSKGKRVCRNTLCIIHNIERKNLRKKAAVNRHVTKQVWSFTQGSCKYWKTSKACASICRYIIWTCFLSLIRILNSLQNKYTILFFCIVLVYKILNYFL